jgi:chromosome partitioning protein
VECQYLALRGVRALLETTQLIHERLHPHLRLLGLVGTMYREESEHCQAVVRELRAVFGERVFEALIEYDEAVAEAPTARQSVLAYRPESPAAADYRRLADEVLHRSP